MFKFSMVIFILFGFLFIHNLSAAELTKKSQPPFFKKKIAQDHQTIFETDNIHDTLPFIDNNTIAVFDIDYTLFRSETSLGTPEWAFHLIEREIKKGRSRKEAFKLHYEAWMRAQEFNEIVLLDDNIANLLKQIKKDSAVIIALTSRQPVSAPITIKQLQKYNFSFFAKTVSNFQFLNPFENETLFHEGILFTHDLNEKGKVFSAWLQQFSKKSMKKRRITKVVFVDDLEHNIQSMAQEIKRMGLEFVGVRYTRGDSYKHHFNPHWVEKERQILMSNRSHVEKRLLLKKLGSIH